METDIAVKKRRKDLDMAKGIGIILVVMAHSTLMPESVLQVIHGFHIPLFFIISGMLLSLQKESTVSLRQHFYKKLKSVMLPYALCSVIYILIQQFAVPVYGYPETGKSLKELCIAAISFDGISVLWFLAALFFGELMFLCLKKHLRDSVLLGVCLLLSVLALQGNRLLLAGISPVTFWGLWGIGFVRNILRSLVATGFLAVGYMFEKYGKGALEKIPLWACSFSGLCCLCFSAISSLYNGPVDLHNLVCHHTFFYFFSAIIGAAFVLLLCRCLCEKRWMGWLSVVGVHSLLIMVTHLDFLYLYHAVKWGYAVADVSPRAKQFVFYLVIIVSMILLEGMTVQLMKAIKYSFKKVKR